MTTNSIPTNSKKSEKEISQILQLLQSKVEYLKRDITISQQIHNTGGSTSLIRDIEKAIENPIASLFALRSKTDNSIIGLIDRLFITLVRDQKELVQAFYKNTAQLDSILYYIILHEDTNENRESIFELLDFYDTAEFASVFPVNFQFIPKELSGKIKEAEKISFDL